MARETEVSLAMSLRVTRSAEALGGLLRKALEEEFSGGMPRVGTCISAKAKPDQEGMESRGEGCGQSRSI